MRGRKHSSSVKSSSYTFRGLRIDFPHSWGSSQPSANPVSGDLTSFPDLGGTRHKHNAQTYMHEKNPYTNIKRNKQMLSEIPN